MTRKPSMYNRHLLQYC